MLKFFSIIMIFTALSSFGRSIYDSYECGTEFQPFDQLMNEVRFPTTDSQKVEVWINELQRLCEKYPNYPEKAAALYFAGSYSFEQKNYKSAQKFLVKAKLLNPELTTKTPLNKYLQDSEIKTKQLFMININSYIIVSWSLLILIILLFGMQNNKFTKRQLVCCSAGALFGIITISLWFSINTSASANGLDKFYLEPVLMRSTILQADSSALVNLLLFCIVTILITSFSSLASTVLKRCQLLFPMLTAIIVGACCSVIYFQQNCQDTHRTGTGLFKRISFPETPVLWHHEVPDEMIKMYDPDMQLTIKAAKEKKRLEK